MSVSSHSVLLIAPLECRSQDKRDFYLLFDLPIHSSRFSGTSGRDRQDEREGRSRISTLSEDLNTCEMGLWEWIKTGEFNHLHVDVSGSKNT
ncbi:hypothetical protein QQF64_026674 [Cirrhinus molitorella]|uniref:MHC class I antigen n=1 Tax=Cirrhinus molitorella TaxID=172907 RepID=A0ABR3NA96_9TELE